MTTTTATLPNLGMYHNAHHHSSYGSSQSGGGAAAGVAGSNTSTNSSNSTAATAANHTSADSGLAPASSFDTVPGSQHSAGGGSWGYSSAGTGYSHGSLYNSNNAPNGSAGGGGGYYSSNNSAAMSNGASNGAGPYTNAYGYNLPPHQAGSAAGTTGGYASSHNSASGGLPGSGASSMTLNSNSTGSAHHSGANTPTSQSAYVHHSHPHSMSNGGFPQGGYGGAAAAAHHQPVNGAGYYSQHASNGGINTSPSYTTAPQYSTQLPLAGRHRITTTLWEDEGTLCFQVDARGVCVARRHDNNMINGTKLLNVCGMSRGKRDGILKNEKERIVVKVGAMHLKGVWITFQRGKQLAEQNGILDVLYPLFEQNIQQFLYTADNYPRTAAVMAAAQERQAQRSRASLGTDSPNGYSSGRTSSGSASGSISGNAPGLARSTTMPSQLSSAGAAGYHSNSSGYIPGSHAAHMSFAHSGGGGGGGMLNFPQRPSPVDRKYSNGGLDASILSSSTISMNNGTAAHKYRTNAGQLKRENSFGNGNGGEINNFAYYDRM